MYFVFCCGCSDEPFPLLVIPSNLSLIVLERSPVRWAIKLILFRYENACCLLFSPTTNCVLCQYDNELKVNLDKIDRNAAKKFISEPSIIKDEAFYKRVCRVNEAPVIITSTEAVGTARARCGHYEAYLDYIMEEEALRTAGAPVFPVFIR